MLRRAAGFGFWVGILVLLSSVVGCDYTGYGSYQPPLEGDEDSDDVADGDTVEDGDEELVTGAGSCEDPLIPTGASATIAGSGELSDLASALTGTSCLPVAPAARLLVDGDLDVEVETEIETETETEAEIEAEIEAETDVVDTEAETETVDGDTDAVETETETVDGDTTETDTVDGDTTESDTVDGDVIVDGDLDAETEGEGEVIVPMIGNGPELVMKLSLKLGDTVDISFGGDSFDAVIYVLSLSCADDAVCQWPSEGVQNAAGLGEPEVLSFVSNIEGVVYVVLDSLDADSSGAYDYQITVTSDEGGTPPEAGKVGAACEKDADCDTNDCLTTQVLKALLGEDIPIVNGYCSTVDLFVDTCSDTCNAENGGFCIGGGFMGESYAIVNLCLRPCETNGDCRIEDNQVCLDPQDWVDKGWLDEATKQQYFGDNKACLPTDFLAVMEGELQLNAGN